MAKLNMAYLSSLKNRAKLLSSYIAGVTISGTPCPRHITVPFGAEAPSGHVAIFEKKRPEQSHLLPEACSPNGTDEFGPRGPGLNPILGVMADNRRQRQTERPPPEPSDILKRFYALYDDKIRYYKKKVSKLYACLTHFCLRVRFKTEHFYC